VQEAAGMFGRLTVYGLFSGTSETSPGLALHDLFASLFAVGELRTRGTHWKSDSDRVYILPSLMSCFHFSLAFGTTTRVVPADPTC